MSASGTAPAVSCGAPDGPAGAGPAVGRRSSPPDVSDRNHSTRYTRSEYCSSLTWLQQYADDHPFTLVITQAAWDVAAARR